MHLQFYQIYNDLGISNKNICNFSKKYNLAYSK